MYMTDIAEKRWIQAASSRPRPPSSASKKRILERLTAAETLERYLHTKYVGQKRFSLEGGESSIVAMDELIRAGQQGRAGNRHRHGPPWPPERAGQHPGQVAEHAVLRVRRQGRVRLSAGDVKYHMGFSSDVMTAGGPVHLTLAFNPSHLEIVNPVVEGSVYARQTRRGERQGRGLPVLIHGDAAVAGQGVNQEMLNFAQTRGYGTGGTMHIVVNNQIGFTTSDPRDYRSSPYCTDIFKMGEARSSTSMATIRKPWPRDGPGRRVPPEFKKDVVVDIICFRKLGHNEPTSRW
jgi:2-oxoglutarate dehydrogenase E1 component